ncbi:MAG: hypothetical protein FWD71_02250 [Oscillospiraceae bacterium]|nr:hypothetical protein [Oscillospiraceae bacterium]
MFDIKTIALKDLAYIKFCIVDEIQKDFIKTKWITSANLLPNNAISIPLPEYELKPNDKLSVYSGDIIIKRINPTYVNYIASELKNIYVYNNLIIVKPRNINSKYLACILNNKIEALGIKSSVGAIKATVNRLELENLPIPVCPESKQELIGELWLKSMMKKKMRLRLAELENIRELAVINKLISPKNRRN